MTCDNTGNGANYGVSWHFDVRFARNNDGWNLPTAEIRAGPVVDDASNLYICMMNPWRILKFDGLTGALLWYHEKLDIFFKCS